LGEKRRETKKKKGELNPNKRRMITSGGRKEGLLMRTLRKRRFGITKVTGGPGSLVKLRFSAVKKGQSSCRREITFNRGKEIKGSFPPVKTLTRARRSTRPTLKK